MGNKIEKGVTYAVNKFGNLSDGVNGLLSSKRQLITKQIINAVLLLIILLIFGCFDFLHLVFHYEYLTDANFWLDVVIKAIADICSYNIGINFIIDEIIKRNTILNNLTRAYEKLNGVKQDDFDEFIVIYNREQKIIAYKNKITRQIYLLNKRTKRSDKILYNKLKKENALETTTNKYCIKRKELEYLRTDAYIKENVDSLDIRYIDVDPSVFEMEIDGTQKVVNNKVVGSISKGRAIASSTTLFGVVIGSIIIRSFTLAPNKQDFENQMVAAAHYAAKISADIAIIVWQFLRGILGTHNIVSQQLTNPLEERVKILKKYYVWRIAKGEVAPQCYYEMLEETDEQPSTNVAEESDGTQEIEMSESEYKALLEAQKKED